MFHAFHSARAFVVVVVAALVFGAAGCFFPDTERLTTRLHDECHVGPLEFPPCCGPDEECVDAMYARWIGRNVDTLDEQQCLLATPCEFDPETGREPDFDRVFGCFLDDEEPVDTDGCEGDCLDFIFGCNDGDTCDAAVANACVDEFDACVGACRSAF